MSDENREDPSVEQIPRPPEPAEADSSPAPDRVRARQVDAQLIVDTPSTNAVTIVESPGTVAPAAPGLVTADMLILGLQQLRTRIPGFVHLTPHESRAMSRAANLDEDFANAGIHAASLWDEAKQMTGFTAAELRELADEARRWDEVERELRIALKGITHANIQRRHRFGSAILLVYTVLARLVTIPSYAHLRPYYEEMKRLYLRATKAGGKKGKGREGE